MAKWDFKIVGASFVKELVPIADDVQPRSQSFMQPSFHLEGGKIVMKESGQYVTAIYFPQIGEIGGVAPTDIEDAYAKLLVLVENFNGGEGTPQNLAQTLAIDNKTNDIPIVSNNALALVYVNDDYTRLSYESQAFTISNASVQLYSGVPVDFNSTISTDFTTPILRYNNEEVATQDWVTSQGYGTGTVTSVAVSTANGFAGSSSGGATPSLTISTTATGVLKGNGTAISAATAETDYTTPTGAGALTNKTMSGVTNTFTNIPQSAVTNLTTDLANKQNIPFEIQFKQTTIDDPLIILSGSIQGNRGATITPSLVVNGIYKLTASTDIFKDLKDCYKRTDYYDVNILNFAGSSVIFTWFWYYIDDYTLEVVVTDGLGGDPVAEFLTDYVLLKAEYKD